MLILLSLEGGRRKAVNIYTRNDMYSETTICAPACPPGGALSLIRVSGPETYRICSNIIKFPGSKKELTSIIPYTIHYGQIMDGGRLLDEVVISCFRKPKSYTGEDSIEISCHGSPYIQKRILELLILNGCKLAMPGEFTQRAFLNGKFDLSQAEAVADLISSESRTAHRIAINQMRGGLSKEFSILRQQLLDFTSLIELELDFSEEDVEFAARDKLKQLVEEILIKTKEIRNTFELGNALKKGVSVAIIGKPNVGKSTMLNSLLKDEKAIVSEIAGTTRDSIEDTISIGGILFRFTDTAGIRETSDVIESMGIKRTWQKISSASVILLLTDAQEEREAIQKTFMEMRGQIDKDSQYLFLLLNKSDLVSEKKLNDIIESIKHGANEQILPVSAKTGLNHDLLLTRLKEVVSHGKELEDQTIISNVRHLEALNETINNLERVITGLEQGLTEDFIAQDLRQAVYYLGSITGEVTTDEVLGNIFRNFCIGK